MFDSEFIKHYVDTIAINVLKLRGTMTQEEFAKKVGVSRATIARMETRNNFEIRSLLKIAEAFRLYPFDLCMTEEERARVKAEVSAAREDLKREIVSEVLREIKK